MYRKNTRINPAQNDHGQNDDTPGPANRRQPVAHRHLVRPGAGTGIAQGGDLNGDGIEDNGHRGRHKRGGEKRQNRLLGQHRIEDHHRRWRHNNPKRAPRRNRPRRQPAVIPARQHFRHGHPAKGGGGCNPRSADRTKSRTGHNRCGRQSAAPVPEQSIRHIIDIRGQPAGRGQTAHQHEQRDHRQIERPHGRGRFTGHQRQGRAPAHDLGKPGHASQRHGNANRHMQHDQQHHHGTADRGEGKGIHGGSLLGGDNHWAAVIGRRS